MTYLTTVIYGKRTEPLLYKLIIFSNKNSLFSQPTSAREPTLAYQYPEEVQERQ